MQKGADVNALYAPGTDWQDRAQMLFASDVNSSLHVSMRKISIHVVCLFCLLDCSPACCLL